MRATHRTSHDEDARRDARRSPANRLGLDYRSAPPHRVPTRIVDIHTHVHAGRTTVAFFEATQLYGVDTIVTMSPLDQVPALRAAWPGRLAFIAIPDWHRMENSPAFQRAWLDDLAAFRERGARLMKFWAAPPLRARLGLTLTDAFFDPLLRAGLDLGYDFMVHVGDPSAWFAPGGRYADAAVYGTKRDQYAQLEHVLAAVAPRTVIAAHMGGSIEEPEFLQTLLDRHPHLMLDSSATKWIARGVAAQPHLIRDFLIRNQDRVLFGSDLVVADDYDFEHYASRYWVQRTMWETAYQGESPIEDPDAGPSPRLAGLDLPNEVLRKLYAANAERLGFGTCAD